jgi:hypothetical protein
MDEFPMRKGFTPTHLPHIGFVAPLLLTIVCLTSTQATAQTIGQGVYRDGFPRFVRFDPAATQNVVLSDTVVTLAAIPTAITDPDTFVLSGIDWRYPSAAPPLVSPTDISKIPEALEASPALQDFYLITDPPSRKVYLINTSAPGGVENSFGGLGVLDKPVATIAYQDSAGKFKIIVSDQGANAIIQVDWTLKTIDWRLDNTVLTGANQLSAPSDAVPLSNGREVLICDTGRNRLMVVDIRTRTVVWEFSKAPNDNLSLNLPVDVEVDPSTGLFVITDKNNHRVLMVHRGTKENRWQFGTGQAGSGGDRLNSPTDANALPNGNVLISDAGNRRLIEVNRQMSIVYTFAHPLQDLRVATRIVENVADLNKTLVIAANLPVSQNALPLRLAYANEVFLSKQANFDFSTAVDYDSLSFPRAALDVPAGTRLRLQLRSANVITELANAKWYGPKDTTDFYLGPATAINRVHDGHRFIQYRALLNNDDNAQRISDPLLTPVLRRVKISAHYFDTNTTGMITSTAIRDSMKLIITSWRKLIVNSVLPADPQQRTQVQITVNIRDEANQTNLFSQPLSSTTGLSQFDLALVDLLRRRQAVRLQAVLKTNNSSITPKLNDWQLEWQNTPSTASSLKFTDPSGRPVDFYRVAPVEDNPPLDRGTVFLTLEDLNLLPIEDAVNLQIRAVRSGDQQIVQLIEQPTGLFIISPGYPAVMTSAAPNRLNVLEGKSTRDTLTVRYVDPTDPTDISTARVLLIQNVKGTLRIENRRGAKLDTVSVGDTLFVHIIGETDRDFSPARDSLVVKFFNTLISDTENLTLYEVANPTTRIFDTGEFRGRTGIPIVKSAGGLVNDGKLQVSGGDQVRVEFIDLDGAILQESVQVRPALDEPNLLLLAGNKAFDFFVAPNPYRADQHAGDGLRLGVVANTGDVLIERIEIYNIAGERIRILEGSDVPLQSLITRGRAAATPRGNFWWNLRTDAGAGVASGTYWAKIYLRFTDSGTGTTQAVTSMRKFVVVQ